MFDNRNDTELIFLHARSLPTHDERAAYIAQMCERNPDRKAHVEELLRKDIEPDSLLDQPIHGQIANRDLSGKSTDVSLDYLFLTPSTVPGSHGRLGEFEILGVIGCGGMGIVLKASQTLPKRMVAIKVPRRDLVDKPKELNRFLREANAAANVAHQHVITIHAVKDINIDSPQPTSAPTQPPFVVMEYIEGQSLQQKIDKVGALDLKEILRIGMQVASGLAAAHEKGLVHRDIKPLNILLKNPNQDVKIIDFGLARATDETRITQSGIIVGTPEYMSPEQAQGHLSPTIDSRSDLFSLGSLLYEMCTGKSPFRASTQLEAINRVCKEIPEPIGQLNPNIPSRLIAIITKLHAKNPDERFQSAAEVAQLLEKMLLSMPDAKSDESGHSRVNTTGEPSPSHIQRLLQKHHVKVAVFGFLALIGFTGIFRMWEPRDPTLSSSPLLRNPSERTLRPPYQNKHTFFADEDIEVSPDGIKFRAAAKDRYTTHCLDDLESDCSVTLKVSEDWVDGQQVGIRLRCHDHNAVYEFLVRMIPPYSCVGEPQNARETFSGGLSRGGHLECVIQRGDIVLQRQWLLVSLLSPSSLALRAFRRGDHLSLAVNAVPVIECFDPFPLFGDKWNCDVINHSSAKLKEMQLTGKHSGLERKMNARDVANTSFKKGTFDDAFTQYQAILDSSTDEQIRAECRVKQAMCLEKVGKRKDARLILEDVAVGTEGEWQRWQLVAASRLWMLNLTPGDQQNWQLMPESLLNTNDVSRFVRVCPESWRQEIRSHYMEQDAFAKRLVFREGRRNRLRSLASIDKLMSYDGLPSFEGLRAEILGWEYHRDVNNPDDRRKKDTLRNAFDAAKRLMDTYPEYRESHFLFERLVRLRRAYLPSPEVLASTLRDIEALAESDQKQTAEVRLFNQLQFARILASRGDIARSGLVLQEAEKLLNFINENNGKAHSLTVGNLFLLRGFLSLETGDRTKARLAWSRGFHALRNQFRETDDSGMICLVYFTLGALSDELTDKDVDDHFHPSRLINTGTIADRPLSELLARHGYLADSLNRIGQTEKAQALCRNLAFDELTVGDYDKFVAALISDVIQSNVFANECSSGQSDLIWEFSQRLLHDFSIRGKLSLADVLGAITTFSANSDVPSAILQKTTTNFEAQYLIAQYSSQPHLTPLKRNLPLIPANLPKTRTQLQDLMTQSTGSPEYEWLTELIRRDLMLIQEGKGTLELINRTGNPLSVQIAQAGQEPQNLSVDKALMFDVAPASYEVTASIGGRKVFSKVVEVHAIRTQSLVME